MIILTPAEMRAVDKRAIEAGFPEILLMEIAGRAVGEKARLLLEEAGHDHHHPGKRVSGLAGKEVLVITGKGNNGGDGLVAARYLDMWGFRVTILLLAEAEELTASSLCNYQLCQLREIEILSCNNPTGYREEIANLLLRADLVIDALLGTGIKGPVKGPYREMISLINQFSRLVLAVDIPSGIDGETGAVLGEAVQADFTLTMAFPKIGLVVYPGRDYCGEIEIVDLGIPLDYALAEEPGHFMLDEEEARGSCLKGPGFSQGCFWPGRGNWRFCWHVRGSFPQCLCCPEGRGWPGQVAVPEEIQSTVAAYSAELMTLGPEEPTRPAHREEYQAAE